MCPYNGVTGSYSAPSNSWNPAVDGTDISTTDWAAILADLSTALSTTITKDGQTTPTANLPMGGFKLTGLGNGAAPTDAVNLSQLTPALGTMTGFLGGLTLSAAGSSATFGIAAGAAANSTSALLLSLASAFTKTTSSWAVGTATGSLDTGSIANSTWYHVFIIGAPTVASDILVSLSPTAPTLPATYTLFRRIGSMKTDSSAQWIKFSQDGNEFLWAIEINDFNAALTAANTAQNQPMTVPTGVKVLAILHGFWGGGGAMNDSFMINSEDQTSVLSNATIGNVTALTPYQGAGAAYTAWAANVRTDTSAQIRINATNNTSNLVIATRGWFDRRGQG